jgi:hypothetical protein
MFQLRRSTGMKFVLTHCTVFTIIFKTSLARKTWHSYTLAAFSWKLQSQWHARTMSKYTGFYFTSFSYYKMPICIAAVIPLLSAHFRVLNVGFHCPQFRCGLLPRVLLQHNIQLCLKGYYACRHSYASRSWELFTKWREPSRMELNSLNTQHATLPTDTIHQPYHVQGLECLPGESFWMQTLNNGRHDIQGPRATTFWDEKKSLTSVSQFGERFILFRLNATSIMLSGHRG